MAKSSKNEEIKRIYINNMFKNPENLNTPTQTCSKILSGILNRNKDGRMIVTRIGFCRRKTLIKQENR